MRKLLPTSGFLSICPSDVMMKKLVSFDYSAKVKRFREVIHSGHVSGRKAGDRKVSSKLPVNRYL